MRAASLFPNRVFKFDHALILPEPVIREDKWFQAIWRVQVLGWGDKFSLFPSGLILPPGFWRFRAKNESTNMNDIYNIGRPEFHDRVVQIMESYRSGRGEGHFTTVTRHAIMLYEELRPRHQLDSRFRTILWAAAMLHDIGADPKCGHSPSSHAWRSADIILREDVRDNDIAAHEVAVVASLHRREDSDADKILGMTYEPVKRFITPELLKLSAILRVADGLDRHDDPGITKFTLMGDTVLVEGTGKGFGDNYKQAVGKSGLLKKELGLELSRKPVESRSKTHSGI